MNLDPTPHYGRIIRIRPWRRPLMTQEPVRATDAPLYSFRIQQGSTEIAGATARSATGIIVGRVRLSMRDPDGNNHPLGFLHQIRMAPGEDLPTPALRYLDGLIAGLSAYREWLGHALREATADTAENRRAPEDELLGGAGQPPVEAASGFGAPEAPTDPETTGMTTAENPREKGSTPGE